MATVKDRVVALCKARGITVKQMQEETGIGNIVSRWDKYNPRMDKLTAVAAYFGVPVESLMGDTMPEQKENPIGFDPDEELKEAEKRGKYSYFIDLLDMSTPKAREEALALLISRLRNQ